MSLSGEGGALSGAAKVLVGWLRDWLWRGGARPVSRTWTDPLSVVTKVATAGAAFAVAADRLLGAFPLPIGPTGVFYFKIIVAGLYLLFANHVVTAKDTRAGEASPVPGRSSGPDVIVYRYAETDRWIARLSVLLLAVLLALSTVPEPNDCPVRAEITTVSTGIDAQPQKIRLMSGARTVAEHVVTSGNPVAMTVPARYLKDWSVSLVWTDGQVSEFDGFSGCPAAEDRTSSDGRSKISLSKR